jgi:hypothetical protein
VEIWCIFPVFGILNHEKSGNLGSSHSYNQRIVTSRIIWPRLEKLGFFSRKAIFRNFMLLAWRTELPDFCITQKHQNGKKYTTLPLNYKIALKYTEWQ